LLSHHPTMPLPSCSLDSFSSLLKREIHSTQHTAPNIQVHCLFVAPGCATTNKEDKEQDKEEEEEEEEEVIQQVLLLVKKKYKKKKKDRELEPVSDKKYKRGQNIRNIIELIGKLYNYIVYICSSANCII
jgi:hypothetical protein